MRHSDADVVQRLVDAKIPESSVLDYKRDLLLGSDGEKRELLRDLTAMGNGGGGTLIFGVSEKSGNDGIPDVVAPLTDPSVAVRLEDVVRDGARPPLLFEHAEYPVNGGFVMVVDVVPSALGPYMVSAYRNPGYYTRHGKSNAPMTEAEVRSAYTIALRSAERRAARWEERAFPLEAETRVPRLTVSAVPREPSPEILDLRRLQLGDLTPPSELQQPMSVGGLAAALHGMRLWADGFTGEAGEGSDNYLAVRVHRDGSIGIAQLIGGDLRMGEVLRILNSHLLYLGWVWDRFGLRRPVELRVVLHGIDQCQMPGNVATTARVLPVTAAGLDLRDLARMEEVLSWELSRAPVRHRTLDDFSDRLAQAFGSPRYDNLFRRGRLYGADGKVTPYALLGGLLTRDGGGAAGVDTAGAVQHLNRHVCAYVVDGVILDPAGNALAVTEFAPGAGCPADFIADQPEIENEVAQAPLRAATPGTEPPAPTGSWASRTLAEVLDPRQGAGP